MPRNFKLLLLIVPILLVIIIVLLVFKFFSSSPEGKQLITFAGSGSPGFKDGSGKNAEFNRPGGLTLDSNGNLLVADTNNSLIRRINTNDSMVSTIAGCTKNIDSNGYNKSGYIDGNSTDAIFNKPRSIVCDSRGVIYVADTGNNVIRRIENNRVTTFAGGNRHGKPGYKDGRPSEALFNKPVGMCFDKNGIIYITDSLNHVIRSVNKKGEVSTFAGSYSQTGGYKDGALLNARFNEPCSITIDDNGNFYVLDSGNQLIRKITGNKVTTISGTRNEFITGTSYVQGSYRDGETADAGFNFPKGVFASNSRFILIADSWNNCIRIINPEGRVSTLAGNGKPGNKDGHALCSCLNCPTSLIYQSGYLYISDSMNNTIRKMSIDFQNATF